MTPKKANKRRLVFVVTSPFAVNAFLRSHIYALSKFYKVTICVNTKAYPLLEELNAIATIKHIDICRKISLISDIYSFFQLLRYMAENRPFIVHSLTPKAGLLAMLAAFLLRLPFRYHTFTGQVWSNKSGIQRVILKAVDKIMVRISSQVLADSWSQCAFLWDQGVVERGQISVLGKGSISGVDLCKFQPDEKMYNQLRNREKVARHIPIFLFVGRMTKDKGIRDLIEIFSELHSQNRNYVLWLVGPNEGELSPAMMSKFGEVGSNIRWFGPTCSPEAYMAAADVLVLPSYREGFGSVIIEAAACEVPAIAYRIDGVVDAVEDEKTGVLVPVGDVWELKRAITTLAESPDIVRNMGASARQRVSKYFSSETLSSYLLEFYKKHTKSRDKHNPNTGVL